MTREELMEFMKATRGRGVWHFVTESGKELNGTDIEGAVIKALEQEPCEDAVSRRAVVELIEGWWLGHTKEDDLATEVKALPAVTPTAKWIPVSERTPEEHVCDDGFVEPSVSVLVQLNNKDMKVSRYWGSRERYKDRPWIDLSYPTTLEVVAWMPLPEPYGEREGRE